LANLLRSLPYVEKLLESLLAYKSVCIKDASMI
jgi:hypothetical protein